MTMTRDDLDNSKNERRAAHQWKIVHTQVKWQRAYKNTISASDYYTLKSYILFYWLYFLVIDNCFCSSCRNGGIRVSGSMAV